MVYEWHKPPPAQKKNGLILTRDFSAFSFFSWYVLCVHVGTSVGMEFKAFNYVKEEACPAHGTLEAKRRDNVELRYQHPLLSEFVQNLISFH